MEIAGKSSKDELDLDKLKLDLEREKLIIEQENFKREQKTEVLKIFITAMSIIIPIAMAYLTIQSNFQIEEDRANQNQKLLEESARSNFLLKAAEIVMNARTTNETKNRANAMKILFPDQLPDNFGDSFIYSQNKPYDGGEIFYGTLSLKDSQNNTISLTNQKFKVIYKPITEYNRRIKINGSNRSINITNFAINRENITPDSYIHIDLSGENA